MRIDRTGLGKNMRIEEEVVTDRRTISIRSVWSITRGVEVLREQRAEAKRFSRCLAGNVERENSVHSTSQEGS